MWRNLRISSNHFLCQPEWHTQAKRMAFILKRKNVPALSKISAMFPRVLRKKDFYYDWVEDTNNKKKPPLQLVLTEDVPGVGMKGELIEVNIYIGYRDLIIPKLAVYADSEEAQEFLFLRDEIQRSSKYSKIIENYLASQAIEIVLSHDEKWKLEPWHVKVGLRKIGIMTNEDCITIPKEISGPNLEIENKDFVVYLTMNKLDKFPLRCRIYHWSNSEPELNNKNINVFSPSEPLFPDEKEIIEDLIRIENEIKKSRMLKGEDLINQKESKNKKK